MSKKLFLIALALLLALGLVGCVRQHNTVGPVRDNPGGPGHDPFGASNLFYNLGYSDVYFTDFGVCYRWGDCVPWSDVRIGGVFPYSTAPAAADGRGGVSTTTAGPTKDHPWGGDNAATIEGAGDPLYCSSAGRFVIIATGVGPGGKYIYVRFVGGVGDGMYSLIDPLFLEYTRCGVFDPFSMIFICKGGDL